jgi:hypothetical protein
LRVHVKDAVMQRRTRIPQDSTEKPAADNCEFRSGFVPQLL